jgi:CubicO group peptidase (beta-lactamase class C family)
MFAQKLNIASLDSLFAVLETRGVAMGSLSISRDGVILYQNEIGYRYIDGDKKISAEKDTKYRIGSVSKMFTAVMIFQLIEEGSISLNQKLDAYFPSLPNANKISIGNLLNHRSGLHDYTEGTNFQEWMDKPMTHEQLLKIISEKGADFEPGTKAQYSNSNYLLLGYIIEMCSGMSYDSALIKRIVSKIGLQDTEYGRPINLSKNESASYKNVNNGWKREKETHMSIHGGAGSIVSTARDLTRFIEALFDHKLIAKSSVDKMKTLEDGYGMGLFPLDYNKKNAYGHNGRIEEFYSSVRYFPDEKLAVAYISNGIIYPRADILDGILKIMFNEPFTVPFSHPITLTSDDLNKYLGVYASGKMPMVVTCTKENSRLLLHFQDNIFELVPINNNYFMHAASGSFFEFFPSTGELQIKETDNIYYLKKK